MHDDCVMCEDIAKKYSEDERAALVIAYNADRVDVELYTRSGRYMRLTKGMGVTKKVATELVKKGGAYWAVSTGGWEIRWLGDCFEAAHMVDGEALRDD